MRPIPIVAPRRTPIPEPTQIAQPPENLILALEELHAQALTDMPGDVTVHEPRSGIVHREGKHEVSAGGHGGRVAARRIDEREPVRRPVPLSGAGAEDVEVVAVQVDRMRQVDGLIRSGLHDPERPGGVGAVELDEVVPSGIRCVAVDDVLQRRSVPSDVDV